MADIETRIREELDRLEAEEGLRVLYACESGSRAWGFPSKDSDWDVRFLYVRPPAHYVSIGKTSDVVERPITDELDVAGWDLPKALELFRKSNPPLLEWLRSPIVYREVGTAAARLRELTPSYYSPLACMYHYLHMAQGNDREFLRGEVVRLKKYFYVLRPVLACLWIERGLGPVPTEFAALVDGLVDDAGLRAAIEDLLARKRAGEELDRGPRIAPISDFLDAELARLTAEDQPPPATKDPAPLDRLLVEVLAETWGDRLLAGED